MRWIVISPASVLMFSFKQVRILNKRVHLCLHSTDVRVMNTLNGFIGNISVRVMNDQRHKIYHAICTSLRKLLASYDEPRLVSAGSHPAIIR